MFISFPNILSKRMKFIYILLVLFISNSFLLANNINISGVSLTDQNIVDHYSFIQFNISWDNSWRTDTAPNNWDAAWVFVKYRVSSESGGDGIWRHVLLNTSSYFSPGGCTITPSSDGVGAFIYRSSNGSGTFTANGVKLRWNYGLSIKNSVGPVYISDYDIVDIKVFGIEMVYVPEGSFYVGGLWDEEAKFYSYPYPNVPFLISAEDEEIQVGKTDSYFYYNVEEPGDPEEGEPYDYFQGDQSGPIPPIFPKGYNAFYCMKYEITQQQFVDFLNTLTRAQQNTRTATNLAIGITNVVNRYVISNKSILSQRNSIRCDAIIDPIKPITFYCDYNGNDVGGETEDGQCIACNFINWADLAAYFDWSGLRPMTELEFEKACRGPNYPVAREYAWGNASITKNLDFLNPGYPNEISSSNGNCTFDLSYIGFGPTRVGSFALSNTDRQQSGASYYGIMELSGNVWERPITVGKQQGRAFIGTHGDGNLDATGNHNVYSWPGSDASGAGFRGGHWNNAATKCRVGDRWRASLAWEKRNMDYGGRGVRTAP